MEQSSPAGSPRLPVYANSILPQILPPEDESQQGPGFLCLQGSQDNQRPLQDQQSSAKDHYRPTEDHQGPKKESTQSLLKSHLSTAEVEQSPAEDHQKPTDDHQNPAECHQSPIEEQRSPPEEHRSPLKDNHSPTEDHQSPAEDQYSSAKNHDSSTEDHQTPAGKPDQLDLSRQKHQKVTSLEKPNSRDSCQMCQVERGLTNVCLDPVSTEQQGLGGSPPTKETEDSFLKHPPKPDPLNPMSVSIDQTKAGDTNQDQKLDISQESQIQREEPSPTPPVAPSPPLTDQVWTCPPVSQESKLCGFLQKQAGPLKAWKQRWFTYEEKKNQLFYYRTPQDATPLGWVNLCGATFTYPLQGESGIFHIKTPERIFILKAVTPELMLYWLQQLQVKRWEHRLKSICSQQLHNNDNNTTDDFLLPLKSPVGLVGEGAASCPAPRMLLSNVSIKHPLIEIQNSMHSIRKRSSQEWSQFYLDATLNTSPETAPSSLIEMHTPPPLLSLADTAPPSPSSLVETGSESSPVGDKKWRTTWMLRREPVSTETSRLQQDKETLMEEVKAQKELVWILHKALEASQHEKRSCAEFLSAPGEQQRLELLRHRERAAAELRGQVEAAKAETDTTRRSLAQRDAQVCSLQEQIRRLTERNHAKQEVIVKLVDQVTSCLSALPPSVPPVEDQTVRQLNQKVEQLKDDLEAYQTQNKFLNSEILQLTQLWRRSSEQERGLMTKCAHLEARLCQVESRYLVTLRTLQESKGLEPGPRAAVQRMITDALRGGGGAKREKITSDRDHDEYGFKIIPDYEVEDVKLLAKIQALEIRSHHLHQEAGQRPLLARWAQYFAGRSDQDLVPSPELKALLRGGIPLEYRPRVWNWIIRTRTTSIRESHPQRYLQLCEKSQTSPHPASRQIQLDLHRTLTTNQHFSSPSSPALQQLQRILLAFTWQNPAIGYCQGLNRLAAIALLVLQSEEEAFWCLVAVVETIMPQDYYTKNLVASQADQRVLKDFLLDKLPRLASHFEAHGVDVSLITFNWFLVVFVESLPSDILLPLWDAFLYEGTKVLFRYALALFKYKEDDILKIQDSVEIYRYLRFFTTTICDSRKLCSVAFSDMNPFPRRLLRSRRALHLDCLQGELQELEEQQREFVMESAERKDKELHTGVSEDEDDL